MSFQMFGVRKLCLIIWHGNVYNVVRRQQSHRGTLDLQSTEEQYHKPAQTPITEKSTETQI